MELTCPFCGTIHDAVTPVPTNERYYPDDGDVSLCWQCGKPAIIDHRIDGGTRRPTPTEQYRLDAEDELQKAIAAWEKFRQRH